MAEATGGVGASGGPIVRLEGVGLHYRTANGDLLEAVRKADLEIAPGEFVSLIGPSGCGKTTILKLISIGWVLLPYIVIVCTIPILAIAPLLLMWFGFGLWPKIAVVILISFFPIVINTIRGLRSTDYRIMELMDSVSATRMQVFLKVRARASLPLVFAGLKIAVTSSVIGAVVGEFIGADTGLGYLIINASTRLDTELLFSAMVLLAALGLSLFGLLAAAERHFVFWGHQEST